ncbi:MAG: hypothetical protein PHF86_04300 [Candidatus Nanoarchaeia archaeon]|jgi:hypothetical protein|nr:hypothetical protein [Candidatus Nanoarchaeia archaeon]
MKKEAFNKENLVDLFSQLIKVLTREKDHGDLESLISQVRELSSNIFAELKKPKHSKIVDEILKEAKYKRFFSVGPDTHGTLVKMPGGGFMVEFSGTIGKNDDADNIIKTLKDAWEKLKI